MPRRPGLALAALVALMVSSGCYRSHEIGGPAVDGGPLDPPALCAATGGSWRSGPCCPTRCGDECPLDCVSANCRCPDDAIWEGERGCVRSPECR
jgi:hypothetical protein